MGVRYEIRQRVGKKTRTWLKGIPAGHYEQPARNQYEAMVTAHPGTYFELVRRVTIEERLTCTPELSGASRLDTAGQVGDDTPAMAEA